MAIFDDSNYLICGWMKNNLKLRGTELHVFAIIYRHTQGNVSEYTGGIEYLCEWLDKSSNEILDALDSLVKKGYVYHTFINEGSITKSRYRVSELL